MKLLRFPRRRAAAPPPANPLHDRIIILGAANDRFLRLLRDDFRIGDTDWQDAIRAATDALRAAAWSIEALNPVNDYGLSVKTALWPALDRMISGVDMIEKGARDKRQALFDQGGLVLKEAAAMMTAACPIIRGGQCLTRVTRGI
jgi:hypothetical protein